MKSKTTRRSHPMIRSRLRNPTSKSMTTVRWPRNASPASERAINVDIAVGDDLGPGADRGGNDEIGAARIDLGPRPDRLGHQPGFDRNGGHGRCTRGRLAHRSSAWLRSVRGKAGEPGIRGPPELRPGRLLDAAHAPRLAAQGPPPLRKLPR